MLYGVVNAPWLWGLIKRGHTNEMEYVNVITPFHRHYCHPIILIAATRRARKIRNVLHIIDMTRMTTILLSL